jgi:hypothetical protein
MRKVRFAILQIENEELEGVQENPDDAGIIVEKLLFDALGEKYIGKDIDGKLLYKDTANASPILFSNLAQGSGFAVSGRVPLIFTHNGVVNNNTFLGRASNLSGLSAPFVIPKNGSLLEITFSNSVNADFTLEFRLNATTGTPFYTISKTATKFFVQSGLNFPVVAGDLLYVKYIDNGTNASNLAMEVWIRNDGE